MLPFHHRSPARRRVGQGLAAGLIGAALASGPVLRAAPADPQHVMVSLTLEHDGRPLAEPRFWGGLGQSMSLRWQTDAATGWPERWELRLRATRVGEGRLQFDTRLSRGEPLQAMAQPRLIAATGEPARLEVRSDDGQHTLSITWVGRLTDVPPRAKP